jgi:hypothetical protein
MLLDIVCFALKEYGRKNSGMALLFKTWLEGDFLVFGPLVARPDSCQPVKGG